MHWLLLFLFCLPGVASAVVNLTINDLAIDRSPMALPVLPGEVLDIAALAPDHGSVNVLLNGAEVEFSDGRGALTVPAAKGVHQLIFQSADARTEINLLVLIPASEVVSGRLNGFRIDAYPEKPLRGLKVYEHPRGFIEVTEENRLTPVSPSYTLGEFVAKQAGGYPKYVVLRPRLLQKLEIIGDALREAGVNFKKFTIMSGYRTPFYNRAIGNSPYSRHVWGGAADIYIDHQSADGIMDDLNGDGRVNKADASWLWAFIDAMARSGQFGELIGGLGLYGATSAHGPFVHVDVRGFVARW